MYTLVAMHRRILYAAVAVVALSQPGLAQESASSTEEHVIMQTVPPESGPRVTFRESFEAFAQTVDTLGSEIDAVTARLQSMSTATVEERKAEIGALRDRLTALGAQLQPDAPLSQAIDRYESWVAAQIGRLNSQRSNLGPTFVDDLMKRYEENQREVTKAREMVGNQSKAVDLTLQNLVMAEMRASELLLAEDADAAVSELTETLSGIAQTIADIRAKLGQLGTTGV